MITVQNRTPYAVQLVEGPATAALDLYNPAPPPGHVLVVVKATMNLERGGEIAPAPGTRATYVLQGSVPVPAKQQQPIVSASGPTAAGHVEGDLAFAKEGADLVILGSAHPHKREAVPEMQVQLRVGDWQRVLQITGDRAWKKKLFGWSMTEPVPFTEMPLTYERAFGGTVTAADGAVRQYAANPSGRGWLPAVKGVQRDGAALPNIEDLGGRIETPDDEREPAGFAWYPLAWALRHSLGQQPQEDPARPLPRLWNAAHPSLVLPAYPVNQRLRLHGMTTDGPVDFAVPRLPVTLTHDLAGVQESLPASPDTLCLSPAQRTLFVVARWLLPCDAGTDGREIAVVPE